MKHTFPPSTHKVYKPGVGYTITRANLNWIRDRLEADRKKRKDETPIEASEIAAELLIAHPKPRHEERFNRLV